MTMHHDLKIWPQFFDDVSHGRKKAELRINDRDYQAGDTARLAVWYPDEQYYDGRYVVVEITHVLRIADLDAMIKQQLGLNPCMPVVNQLAILSFRLVAVYGDPTERAK